MQIDIVLSSGSDIFDIISLISGIFGIVVSTVSIGVALYVFKEQSRLELKTRADRFLSECRNLVSGDETCLIQLCGVVRSLNPSVQLRRFLYREFSLMVNVDRSAVKSADRLGRLRHISKWSESELMDFMCEKLCELFPKDCAVTSIRANLDDILTKYGDNPLPDLWYVRSTFVGRDSLSRTKGVYSWHIISKLSYELRRYEELIDIGAVPPVRSLLEDVFETFDKDRDKGLLHAYCVCCVVICTVKSVLGVESGFSLYSMVGFVKDLRVEDLYLWMLYEVSLYRSSLEVADK